MIKIEKQIIKNISEDKAKLKKAYPLVGSKYGIVKKQFEFNYNIATGVNFRLVHDGKTAFEIVEGTEKGQTVCIHNIEEFKTEKECLDQIKNLGLIYDAPEAEIIDIDPVREIEDIRVLNG